MTQDQILVKVRSYLCGFRVPLCRLPGGHYCGLRKESSYRHTQILVDRTHNILFGQDLVIFNYFIVKIQTKQASSYLDSKGILHIVVEVQR